MRQDFGPKSWLYPMPVLIIGTYDENGVPNAMNAAWGGISDDNQITISLGKERKTVQNLTVKKCFTVFPATESNVAESDYFGIQHGFDVNKIERVGFHVRKAENVDAPIIEEYPMALECQMLGMSEEEIDGGYRLIGRIVNVSADESVLTDGRIDPMKLKPIIYDSSNRTYLSVGGVVGKAYSDGARFKQ